MVSAHRLMTLSHSTAKSEAAPACVCVCVCVCVYLCASIGAYVLTVFVESVNVYECIRVYVCYEERSGPEEIKKIQMDM
jgi:hypothetical protein